MKRWLGSLLPHAKSCVRESCFEISQQPASFASMGTKPLARTEKISEISPYITLVFA
jgi:hypothetical protein